MGRAAEAVGAKRVRRKARRRGRREARISVVLVFAEGGFSRGFWARISVRAGSAGRGWMVDESRRCEVVK